MSNTTRALKALAEARIVSEDVWTGRPDPSRRLTILTQRMDDMPQRGQIISGEDGNFYCVTRCNTMTANVTDISTGKSFIVKAAAIIYVSDMRGPHWHLSRRRDKMVSLDEAVKAGDQWKGNKPAWAEKTTGQQDAIADKLPTSVFAAVDEDKEEVKEEKKEVEPSKDDKEEKDDKSEVEEKEEKAGEKPVAAGQLEVLVDESGQKLAKKIYTDLISGEEFHNFPKFTLELDELISKYRGNRPVTKQEVKELGDSLEDEDKLSGGENEKPEEAEGDDTKIESSFVDILRKNMSK